MLLVLCCAVTGSDQTVCLCSYSLHDYRLQILQDAADSVLTPRWQTQTQAWTGISQRQLPFSFSLKFQAAHDTDFSQPSHVDNHEHQPELNSSLKSSADAATADTFSPDYIDADHAADVEYALRHMRSHEMSSSRDISDSNNRVAERDDNSAAAYSDAESSRTGSNASHDTGAPGHSDSAQRADMAVLSVSSGSSSSSNSSIDDMHAVQGHSQQQCLPTFSQPLALPTCSNQVAGDSSGSSGGATSAGQLSALPQSLTASARLLAMPTHSSKVAAACSGKPGSAYIVDAAEGHVLRPHNAAEGQVPHDAAAVAEGRVLRPHNAAAVAVGRHAAPMTTKKHVERAVGLVEPAKHATSVPSLDIMIKTGNVVRQSCLLSIPYCLPLGMPVLTTHITAYMSDAYMQRMQWMLYT